LPVGSDYLRKERQETPNKHLSRKSNGTPTCFQPYPKEIDLQKDSMALLRETRRERIKGKNIHQENTDSFQDITRRQKISKEKEREGDGEKEAKARTFIRR
jgi:hypothetical protein